MFSQDKIAAAQIAQLFGSELLRVQQSAQTDSGHQPSIVTMDPKQFLADSPQYKNAKKAEEQRLVQMLQQEAEASCPLPDEPVYNTPPPAPVNLSPKITTDSMPLHQTSVLNVNPSNTTALDRIAFSLEKIATALDKANISISPKPKKIKRTIK